MLMLKEKLKQILTVVPQGSKVIYIDYPMYSNVGDMLIMKGTERFFEDNNINVMKRYSAFDFICKEIPKDWIIILQGGGNMGDLYDTHENLRKQVIQAYPNNRIVILPQTMHFEKRENLLKSTEIYNQHNDLHLFLRDTKCYTEAQSDFTCNLYLSPDMAHQLYPIQTKTPTKKELFFIRVDKEATSDNNYHNSIDWQDVVSKTDLRIMGKIEQKSARLNRKLGIEVLPVAKMWQIHTDKIVNKSIGIFADYEHITTSRLHGHILSCLLDRPNTVLDNSYGKNSSYYEDWTHVVDIAKLKK